MTDDRHDRRVVRERLRDANRHVRTTAVVNGAQGNALPADSTMGVDLFDRELGGAVHRHATRL